MALQAGACLMSLLLALPATEARADEQLPVTTVWVSPNGNDANSGAQDTPLATPQKALQMVRELRKA